MPINMRNLDIDEETLRKLVEKQGVVSGHKVPGTGVAAPMLTRGTSVGPSMQNLTGAMAPPVAPQAIAPAGTVQKQPIGGTARTEALAPYLPAMAKEKERLGEKMEQATVSTKTGMGRAGLYGGGGWSKNLQKLEDIHTEQKEFITGRYELKGIADRVKTFSKKYEDAMNKAAKYAQEEGSRSSTWNMGGRMESARNKDEAFKVAEDMKGQIVALKAELAELSGIPAFADYTTKVMQNLDELEVEHKKVVDEIQGSIQGGDFFADIMPLITAIATGNPMALLPYGQSLAAGKPLEMGEVIPSMLQMAGPVGGMLGGVGQWGGETLGRLGGRLGGMAQQIPGIGQLFGQAGQAPTAPGVSGVSPSPLGFGMAPGTMGLENLGIGDVGGAAAKLGQAAPGVAGDMGSAIQNIPFIKELTAKMGGMDWGKMGEQAGLQQLMGKSPAQALMGSFVGEYGREKRGVQAAKTAQEAEALGLEPSYGVNKETGQLEVTGYKKAKEIKPEKPYKITPAQWPKISKEYDWRTSPKEGFMEMDTPVGVRYGKLKPAKVKEDVTTITIKDLRNIAKGEKSRTKKPGWVKTKLKGTKGHWYVSPLKAEEAGIYKPTKIDIPGAHPWQANIPLIGGFFKRDPETLNIPLNAEEKQTWHEIDIDIFNITEQPDPPSVDELIEELKADDRYLALNAKAQKAMIKYIKAEY